MAVCVFSKDEINDKGYPVCLRCKFPSPVKSIKVTRKCVPRMPSNFKKGKDYLRERDEWRKSGRPVRKKSEISKLYSICTRWEHFQKHRIKIDLGSCKLCGCWLKPKAIWLNKLAWGTTKCPDVPPKWTEASSDEIDSVIPPEEVKEIDQSCCGKVPAKKKKGNKDG